MVILGVLVQALNFDPLRHPPRATLFIAAFGLLLILDEPSLGLAPLLVERVFEIVVTIMESGCAVLIAEQNVQSALGVAHRAHIMEAGRIVKSGPAADLGADPALLSAFIGMDEVS